MIVALTALGLGAMAGRGGPAPDRLAAAPPSPTPTPAVPPPGADLTPPPSASPVTCQSLSAQVTTDAATYRPGASATLTVRIGNGGPTPCRLQVDAGTVEVVVTSGTDRIWSSGDCPAGRIAFDVVLAPGQSTARTVRWPGTRSAPGCPVGQPVAQPGTYRAAARVGELQSPEAVFRVG